MRVLVLGATGNVGTALVRSLTSDPDVHDVIGASRRTAQLPGGARWREVDLGGDLPEDLLDGIDAVVNLAWLMQPTRAPQITWATNVEGTARLLERIRESGVSTLVQASSVGAYSARVGHAAVDEQWPTHGVATSAYSREKAYVERSLDVLERDRPDLRVVRLRPSFTFQAPAAVQQRRLFAGPLVPGRVVAGVRIPVVPVPRALRFQAVHTEDVAAAYHAAVVQGGAHGAYNLAAEDVLDGDRLAELVGGRAVDVPPRLVRSAVRAAWSAHLTPASPGLVDLLLSVPVMETERAQRDLGWQPGWSAQEAVASMLRGLRSGRGADTPPLDPATSGPARSHEIRTALEDTP